MKITLEWRDKTTVICTFDAGWTWDDTVAAMETLHEMADPVDSFRMIAHVRSRRSSLLMQGNIVPNLYRVLSKLPKNLDCVVIVGASQVGTMLIDVVKKSGIGKNIDFAQTMDEAFDRINKVGVHE